MLKYKTKQELEDVFVQADQNSKKKGDYLDRLADWCFDELIRIYRRNQCNQKN